MSEPIDTITFGNGLYANVYPDDSVEQPYEADAGVHIVILSSRYSDPARGACGQTAEDVEQWRQDNAAAWFSIPLYAYDHSAVTYRVGQSNPFNDPWDSARAGIIALKRSEWGNGNPTAAALMAYAQQVAATYTEWANGYCYGYRLYNAQGEELSDCWGFIGRDDLDTHAEAEAKAHLDTDDQASAY